jgi:hypothetical protein
VAVSESWPIRTPIEISAEVAEVEGNWDHWRGNVGPEEGIMSTAARQRRVDGLAGKKRELGFTANIRRNATVFGERERGCGGLVGEQGDGWFA